MSKELEALKELKHWKETNCENGAVWLPLFAVEDIEKALLKSQEQEKENARHKQLEELLGCPLEVREKALKQGFIYNGFTRILNIHCKYDDNGCYLTNSCNKYYLKDYKKTWWLKADRSE